MNELIQSSVVVRLASFDRLASIQMASEAISPASNEARRASRGRFIAPTADLSAPTLGRYATVVADKSAPTLPAPAWLIAYKHFIHPFRFATLFCNAGDPATGRPTFSREFHAYGVALTLFSLRSAPYPLSRNLLRRCSLFCWLLQRDLWPCL